MQTSRQPVRQDPTLLLAEVARHWPMAKGSVAEVHKPCVRAKCRACASGRKHPAFLFAFTDPQGRRRCRYVPRDLVPALRQAITNGRWMEEQMRRGGVRLIEEYRRHRTETARTQEGRSS